MHLLCTPTWLLLDSYLTPNLTQAHCRSVWCQGLFWQTWTFVLIYHSSDRLLVVHGERERERERGEKREKEERERERVTQYVKSKLLDCLWFQPGGPILWGCLEGRFQQVLRQYRAADSPDGCRSAKTALMTRFLECLALSWAVFTPALRKWALLWEVMTLGLTLPSLGYLPVS